MSSTFARRAVIQQHFIFHFCVEWKLRWFPLCLSLLSKSGPCIGFNLLALEFVDFSILSSKSRFKSNENSVAP